ncbi:MAG TPA: bifunctional phosphopantothenoylcysteine decarboxylase/phosphopantothenate--cysteine ligase CoaBC, partial [Terriglobales bacterium]|nr:bifunctional phosphopantothenoylcysteine decarboxylase/phosphopantothenate--cysteine ligase CoaBC [Terriglobales bacterium]
MRILLGISGGIAAYKTPELVRLLQQRGHSVQVALTRAAREFVAPLTLATLSREPLLDDLFPSPAPSSIEHIDVAQAANVVVVAPATAHTLARMALGLADDFLTTALLATPAPVVVAPAMNLEMWRHPATQAHIATLTARGVTVVPPAAGYLACGMVGEGRMAELDAIADAAEHAAQPRQDMRGERVLITAGPTREPLDGVRFLSNRSSGRMGYALAAAAVRRGAAVTLLSGPTSLTPPAGAEWVPVQTADEMAAAAEVAFARCTMAVLAAAVADYRPAQAGAGKIKRGKTAHALELVPTFDILATLGARKQGQLLVGFAAETDTVRAVEYARAKLAAKRADLIVLN